LIEFHNVSRSFRSRDGEEILALKDLSLSIGRNEFVTLVGPSGCGKSTLLRIVAGLILPTRGVAKIDGTAVLAPRDETAMVFQSPTLLPWATVLDNVLFPLRMMGRMGPESRARARELIRLVGLEGFEAKSPRELSGGMQQRDAICRALIHDPQVLLMDEPFGALDALTREEMTLELLRIWERQPKTIVFVTHSIPEAVLLADRVVVMSARPGRIKAIFDIDIPRPRTLHVKREPIFLKYLDDIWTLIEEEVKKSGMFILDDEPAAAAS
jgi:NitT/TauT family transport system ATP-binding protein